jgi:hypothetical protein
MIGRGKKVFVNILLGVTSLFLLLISSGEFGNGKNIVLFLTVLLILVLFNLKETIKFSNRKKNIIILVLVIVGLVYLGYPKKNQRCATPADGQVCTSHYCIGLPVGRPLQSPKCLGIFYGEQTILTPEEWTPRLGY